MFQQNVSKHCIVWYFDRRLQACLAFLCGVGETCVELLLTPLWSSSWNICAMPVDLVPSTKRSKQVLDVKRLQACLTSTRWSRKRFAGSEKLSSAPSLRGSCGIHRHMHTYVCACICTYKIDKKHSSIDILVRRPINSDGFSKSTGFSFPGWSKCPRYLMRFWGNTIDDIRKHLNM